MSEARTQPPAQSEHSPNRRGRRIASWVALGAASTAAIIGTRVALGLLTDSVSDKLADDLWRAPGATPPASSEYDPSRPRLDPYGQPIENTPTPSPSRPQPSPSIAEVPDFAWRSCEANAAVDTDTSSLVVEVSAEYNGSSPTENDPNNLRIVALVEDHHSNILFTETVEDESITKNRVEAGLNSDGRFLPPAERVEIYMAEFPPDSAPSFPNGRNQPNPLEKIPEEYYIPCGVFSVAANGTVTSMGD